MISSKNAVEVGLVSWQGEARRRPLIAAPYSLAPRSTETDTVLTRVLGVTVAKYLFVSLSLAHAGSLGARKRRDAR